ncbi:cytochrome P450 [Streptomyces sp. NA02950]|uniref:cytochrome P450 n=1 Tax=Streptomyces sp. NA02950 TaxID=2742137 RepID=UPI0015900C17|nr:cytochrome P450 [Streptomyces sp. NA02950]QKV90730.1 cytochrome P450 [Streptomyces sp. NA02950]
MMVGGVAPGIDQESELALLDLLGTAFVTDPFPTLGTLRDSTPVHHDPGTGLWLISRYADVRRVLLEPESYLPDNAQKAISRLSIPALRTLAEDGFALPPALANNGGPSHTGLRRLVTRFFAPHRVAAAVPLIEQCARELLSEAQAHVTAHSVYDLSAGYARQLPCRVMMRVLGIEDVEPRLLVSWSDAALELFYGRPRLERQVHLAEQVGAFYRWLMAQADDASVGGLFGALREHRLPDGDVLDRRTAVAACFFVLIAGQSTTGQLISTVLRRAAADPDIWSRVATEDGFSERWVEEVIRREPPVTTWRRVAARDVELSGVRIPAGDELLLMLMGTGSDPEVFADPAELCPHRPNGRQHLSFGLGRHLCPGAHMARTEAAVALRMAASLLPDVELAEVESPPMLGLLSFRAPERVTVRRRRPGR